MVAKKIYEQRLKKQDTVIDIINLLDLLFAILGVFVNPIFFLGVLVFTSLYMFTIIYRKHNNEITNRFCNTKYKLYKVHIIGFLLSFIDLIFTLLITLNLTVFASGIRFVVVLGRNITKVKAFNNLSKLIPTKAAFKQLKLNKSKEYSIYKKSIKRRLKMLEKLKSIREDLIKEKEELVEKHEKEAKEKHEQLSEKYEYEYKKATEELEKELDEKLSQSKKEIEDNITDIDEMIAKKEEKPERIKVSVNEDLSDREDAEELINETDNAKHNDNDNKCEDCDKEDCECKDDDTEEETVEEVEEEKPKKKSFLR